MPLYTFRCKTCGKQFDAIVPYDTEKANCECGKKGRREGVEIPARRNPAYGLQT